MEADYLIAYPERCCLRKLILSVILPRGLKSYFTQCPEATRLELKENWKMKVSLIMIKIVGYVAGPLRALGAFIEFLLNLFSNNGGLFKLPFKILNGSIFETRSETFLSFIGHVVGRSDLYKGGPPDDIRAMNPGDRYFADISVMASTIAYENELLIRKRVDQNWKMHFVEFFDCWNDHMQKNSTQAFILCDKEKDAELIVIAFRGTQPFESDDYVTDLDFSWYESSQMGKVHFGFLEALGLANRSNDKKFSYHLRKQDPEKHMAYHVLLKKLKELLEAHKNAKFIVTGHSLGGALSVLFTAMLFVNEEKLLEKLLAIYTFGQPRVGDKTFADFMNRKLNQNQDVTRYFRIVYSNDLIPRVPFEDNLFMYKHFGSCLYFNCFYSLKNLAEIPNRNFSLVFFVPLRITALWELLQCLVLHYREGKDFKETKLSIVCRILGILVPGLSAHSPVNYINALRLGPALLNPNSGMLED
ncbi:hypothetical protein SUGI_0579730 [Cryptomeria japonica]|nr:hypothetical protein SUGI_0579730 [Cryptomeria japonica]